MKNEDRIAGDIVQHTVKKVQQTVQDGIDIIPDGYEAQLLIVTTVQLLVGTANAIAEGGYPLFAKLPTGQRIVILASILARLLMGEEEKNRKLSIAQNLSDTAAAMDEIKDLFQFRLHED